MKLYQDGSMYAYIKARGDAPMFWFGLFAMLGTPALCLLAQYLFA